MQTSQGTGLAFQAFGVRLGLSLDDPALLPAVEAILPPGWTECADEGVAARFTLGSVDGMHYELTGEDGVPGPAVELEVATGMLDSRIRMEIAQRAEAWTFIHAGAVAVAGRALVLPGLSFAGKTTLVQALIGRGATYYSDEYALLDDAGLVHPYPKPLSIREPDAQRLEIPVPATETPAHTLGAQTGKAPIPIGLIAALTYVPGTAWAPTTLGASEGALLLLSHAVSARDTPDRVLTLVGAAALNAQAIEGERGEADEAAGQLLAMMGAPPGIVAR